MEAVILGSGRLTNLLLPTLLKDGYHVTVLDDDSDALERLAAKGKIDTILILEPHMQDYLQQANIDTSELFLAMSDDDCRNALMAQIARYLFNVPMVICLLDDPHLQELYTELGLDVVGSSSSDISQNVRQALKG